MLTTSAPAPHAAAGAAAPTGARSGAVAPTGARSGAALAAAVLGFFVVTLDAVVVNVALPSMRRDLGGGITGLQWVVDGYTLVFAALLLSAGSLSDRLGRGGRSVPGWRCSCSPPPLVAWRRAWPRWSPPVSSRARRPRR